MRRLLIGMGLCLGVLLVLILSRKGPQAPPEQAVRERIEALHAAVESGDAGTVVRAMSTRFSSRQMTREEAKALIVMTMRRQEWRQIMLADIAVQVHDPTHVHTTMYAVLAQGQAVESLRSLAQTNAGSFKFEFDWELEDDTWMIVSGTYERAHLDNLLR